MLFVARLAQLVERKALNLVVVGSSPTVGDYYSLQQAECMLLLLVASYAMRVGCLV